MSSNEESRGSASAQAEPIGAIEALRQILKHEDERGEHGSIYTIMVASQALSGAEPRPSKATSVDGWIAEMVETWTDDAKGEALLRSDIATLLLIAPEPTSAAMAIRLARYEALTEAIDIARSFVTPLADGSNYPSHEAAAETAEELARRIEELRSAAKPRSGSASPGDPKAAAMAVRLARWEALGEALDIVSAADSTDAAFRELRELRSAAKPRTSAAPHLKECRTKGKNRCICYFDGANEVAETLNKRPDADVRQDVLGAAERICREVADEMKQGGSHRRADIAEECADRIAGFANTFKATPCASAEEGTK